MSVEEGTCDRVVDEVCVEGEGPEIRECGRWVGVGGSAQTTR